MNYLKMRQLAIRMSNIVKGFIRTITGAPPITLEDCVDNKSVVNYQIYGNSTQDGDPTPENPVEVVSVGEYDEETGKYKIPVTASGKNLIPCWQAGWVDTKGNLNTTSYPNRRYTDFIEVKAGNSYVLSGSFSTYTNYTIYDKDFVLLTAVIIGNTSINYRNIPIIDKGRYIRFAHTNIRIDDFQFEKGSIVTGYEPYVEPITTDIYLNKPLEEGKSISYKKDNLPILPTFKSQTTIYTIDTTIQPTMSVTYLSNKRGE